MQHVSQIIGIISAIVGLLWAFYSWVLPAIVNHARRPKLIRLHASKDPIADRYIIWPGMALGIEASNMSPNVGQNKVHFSQHVEKQQVDVYISGDSLTGAATAPDPAVLTVKVPSGLKDGDVSLSVESRNLKSSSVALHFCNQPVAPTLLGFGTDYASKRSSRGAIGKHIAIGGYGFLADAASNIVRFASGNQHFQTTPSIARGDGLLGVVVPTGMPQGPATVTVTPLINGKHGTASNPLTFVVVPPPSIISVTPYTRPGYEFEIFATGIDDRHEDNIWVVLEPYQDRRPVLLKPDRVPTERKVVVRLPYVGVLPGVYDVRLLVDGNYSSNTAIIDIQRRFRFMYKTSFPS